MKCVLLALLVAVGWVAAGELQALSTPGFGNDLNIIELADRLGFYSYLLAANETGLTETLRTSHPITLFIPTNEAFLALSPRIRARWAADPAYYQKLMKYHAIRGAYRAEELKNEVLYDTLDGSFARIDAYNSTTPTPFKDYMNAHIVETNFVATNGIIHVINEIVYEIGNETILERMAESANHSMLYTAIEIVTSLRDKLNSTAAAFTLFAPTNAAINSLPPGIWDMLMKNATTMEKILNYHVTSGGTFYSNGLVNGDSLPTLNSTDELTVSWQDNVLSINNAKVTEANKPAINGVVHVIERVLHPY